jgi:phosphate transport system substrate-binding protein
MKNKVLGLVVSISLAACFDADYQRNGNDVPTAGKIAFGIEIADSFLMAAEMDMFTKEYPKSSFKTSYLSEIALLRQLQLDSLRFVCMNRDLSKSEKDNLEKRERIVRSVKIAETSIVLIVNKQNTLDSVAIQYLNKITSGKQLTWPNGQKITVLVDGKEGSIYNCLNNIFFKNKLNLNTITAINNPQNLIEYVAEHPGAIGFVGLNWLTAKTEELAINLRRKVKILKVENPQMGGYFYPYQSQIKLKQYPFIQEVYMHDLQGYSGLATGLINYIVSQPGQIIVKKSGLIPVKDYGRTILIETE